MDERDGGVSTPRNGSLMEASAWGNGTPDDGWLPASPAPFVNTRYQLAGGMDTPGLAAARAAETQSVYADAGYRKSLGDVERPILVKNTSRGLWDEPEPEEPSYFPDEIGRDGNGRGRWSVSYPRSRRGEGWSKAAFQVVGDVVGKVWEFCKISGAVFTGFRAGGGQGYKVDSDSDSAAQFQAVESNAFWGEKNEDLPGQYPSETLEYIPDYMDQATPDREFTPPRAAKRRQVSSNHNSDEIAKNWFVVPPTAQAPSPTPSKPQPPLRVPARYSMPTASSSGRKTGLSAVAGPASRAGSNANASAQRRPALASQASFSSSHSRVSHAGSPALNKTQGASYASPRGSPTSKIPRPTTPLHGPRHGGSAGGSFVSPRPSTPLHGSRHGGSAGASFIGSGNVESPAAKEAKRWAALRRKEEREADESIRRLDAQLKAMIREGREALGTKIEVDIEDDPEFRTSVGAKKKWKF